MRTTSPLLAIYDENKLPCQLLHNTIERLGFPVAFSCTEQENLFANLRLGNHPAVLLVNADGSWKKKLHVVRKLTAVYDHIEVLVYAYNKNKKIVSEFVRTGVKKVIVNCSIEKLVETLDVLSPFSSLSKTNKSTDALNPFYHILKNKKNLIILQGLASSKSEDEIGLAAGLTSSSVKTYKKRMKDELKCKTIGEVVALAKDYGVL